MNSEPGLFRPFRPFLRPFLRLQRSRRQARVRQHLLALPARLIANSLVDGQVVRLRGKLQIDAVATATVEATIGHLVRMVEGGGELPDFSLVLDDGVKVVVGARAANRAGQLTVLDLWEDKATHATCDGRTDALFRQSRFVPGRTVEACGRARRAPAPDGGGYRGGAGWTLEATDTLVVLFTPPSP